MESSLQSRNHYETLGLTPIATERDIKEAFRRKIGPFETHLLGAAAQVCIAYETLRDPVKRREHDRSLGLLPQTPLQTEVPAVQARWTPFIASPGFTPSLQPVVTSAASPQSIGASGREEEPVVHPKVAAIAASLEELARPVAREDPVPATGLSRSSTGERGPQGRLGGIVADSRNVSPQAPERPNQAGLQPSNRKAASQRTPYPGDVALEDLVREIRQRGLTEKERLSRSDSWSWNWKRPAVALGSLLAGAAAFGAFAGLSVKGGEASAKAESISSRTAPHVSHHPNLVATSITTGTAEPEVKSTIDSIVHSRKTDRSISRVRAETFMEKPAAATPGAVVDPVADPTDQGSAGPAQKIAAKLPLPGKVIARTIERIGYPCGEIASSSSVGDTRGVFTVTCTSGQSYRARAIGGRYHFRRLG